MHKLILYIMHTDTQFIDNMYTDTEYEWHITKLELE